MKRTQSKAVKPARKGAVKVPYEACKAFNDYCNENAIDRTACFLNGMDRHLVALFDLGYSLGRIRRNPRAARATSKGAE